MKNLSQKWGLLGTGERVSGDREEIARARESRRGRGNRSALGKEKAKEKATSSVSE